MFWAVPREWTGQTCAVLASGPSMTRDVAQIVHRSGCRVIAVNNQAIETRVNGQVEPAMAPWADVLYAADRLWWHHNREAVSRFAGLKVTIAPNHCSASPQATADIRMLGNGGQNGFDDRPDHLRTGSNSGYQAVHLAAHFGAARVLLCGFDMHAKRGEHWFGDHAWRPGYRSRYSLFLNSFTRGAPEFAARGVEVVNCTPGSALKCFPFQDLTEALNGSETVRSLREGAQGIAAVPPAPT